MTRSLTPLSLIIEVLLKCQMALPIKDRTRCFSETGITLLFIMSTRTWQAGDPPNVPGSNFISLDQALLICGTAHGVHSVSYLFIQSLAQVAIADFVSIL